MKSSSRSQDFGNQKIKIPIKNPFLGRKRSFASEVNTSDSAHADGEGTWIFSYADLITILMMFFIMMLSISKVSPERFDAFRNALKTNEKVTEKSASQIQSKVTEIDNLRQSKTLLNEVTLAVTSTAGDQNSKILAGAKVLMERVDATKLVASSNEAKDFERLQKELKNLKGLVVTSVPKSKLKESKITISIPSHTFFERNGSVILAGKTDLIIQIYSRIKEMDPQPKIEIASHLQTDTGLGSGVQNIEITAQQSAKILAVFIEHGASNELISASGYGNMRPLIHLRNRFGQINSGSSQANSRIEIGLVQPDKGADLK